MAASQNDFFGVGMLSADPYAARTQQYADILKATSSFQRPQTFSQSAQTPEQRTAGSSNVMSPEAAYSQKQGGASAQAVQEPGDGQVQPGYPGWTPENSTIPVPSSTYSSSGGGGGGMLTDDQYSRIPGDLAGIRGHLADQLWNMLNNPKFSPEIRFEDLIVGMDPSWQQYQNTLYGGLGQGQQAQQGAYNALMGLAGRSPYQMDMNPLANLWSGMQNGGMNPWNAGLAQGLAGGTGATTLDEMARTGGMADLNPAMEAIRAQSMSALNDQLAQIREQYGSRGLGAGSDVSDSLATGASRGIADMNAQQQALQVQAMQAAAQNRIGAAQGIQDWALGGMQNWTQATLGQNQNRIDAFNAGLSGLYNQGQLYNQGMANQIQAASAASGSAGNYMQGLASLAPALGQYPMAAQTNAEANMQRGIDEIIRRSMGPTILPSILGYAANVPAPANYPPPNNSGGVWGALGTLGGAALGTASKPWFLSDREAKEDVEPITDSVSERLRSLPLYRWRYKGDPTRHIGPMAQDFQEAFGVGDGRKLHFSDILGVLLAVQQEQLANG